MTQLTFWFEFASTYSYPAAMRVEGACADAGIELVWRPFLLGPIFKAQGWDTSPFNLYPAKGAYMWRDMERLLQTQGLPPLVRPNPFPQNGLLAARVATLAFAEGWGPDFVRAVFTAQFALGAKIGDPAIVKGLVERLGQSGDGVIDHVSHNAGIKLALRQATEDAQALGIFGAPSFTTADGELFWGNDRLEQAISWAQV